MDKQNSHKLLKEKIERLPLLDAAAYEILALLNNPESNYEIETESSQQNNRLRYIREKIMNLLDRKISAGYLCHMIQSYPNQDNDAEHSRLRKKSLEQALADCEIKIAILRAYIQGKYGDEIKNDWLDQYSRISESYHAKPMNKNSAQKTRPFYFDGTAMQPTEENFQLCRQKCLNANVSQEFDLNPTKSNWLYRTFQALRKKSIWRRIIS
jgi:hypothetical protein